MKFFITITTLLLLVGCSSSTQRADVEVLGGLADGSFEVPNDAIAGTEIGDAVVVQSAERSYPNFQYRDIVEVNDGSETYCVIRSVPNPSFDDSIQSLQVLSYITFESECAPIIGPRFNPDTSDAMSMINVVLWRQFIAGFNGQTVSLDEEFIQEQGELLSEEDVGFASILPIVVDGSVVAFQVSDTSESDACWTQGEEGQGPTFGDGTCNADGTSTPPQPK